MPRNKDKAVIWFRYEGRRYSVSGNDHDDAVANKALKIEKLKADTVEITGNMTVKKWAEEWLKTSKEPDVNASWYNDLTGLVNNYINPAIGSLKVRKVKPIQLEKILKDNRKSKSFNDKLYDLVRQIFQSAYDNDMISDDITKKLKKDKTTQQGHRRSITDHEREVLLEVVENHRGKVFIYLMLYSGVRPGEAAALLWKDINFEDRTISVNKALKSDGVIRPHTKSDAGMRSIPIPDLLYPVLKEHKRGPFSYVCVNSKGNPYKKKTIQTMWKNIKREMDIRMGCTMYQNQITVHAVAPDLELYCLRHTYCTDLQAAGVPINVARELMGHSSIEVTSKIYTHHSDVSIQNALEMINTFNNPPEEDEDEDEAK